MLLKGSQNFFDKIPKYKYLPFACYVFFTPSSVLDYFMISGGCCPLHWTWALERWATKRDPRGKRDSEKHSAKKPPTIEIAKPLSLPREKASQTSAEPRGQVLRTSGPNFCEPRDKVLRSSKKLKFTQKKHKNAVGAKLLRSRRPNF